MYVYIQVIAHAVKMLYKPQTAEERLEGLRKSLKYVSGKVHRCIIYREFCVVRKRLDVCSTKKPRTRETSE